MVDDTVLSPSAITRQHIHQQITQEKRSRSKVPHRGGSLKLNWIGCESGQQGLALALVRIAAAQCSQLATASHFCTTRPCLICVPISILYHYDYDLIMVLV